MSVATFLSTDIEGSTRRWEAAPDAMRIALETHNETLRKAVEVHAGHVFKYTGGRNVRSVRLAAFGRRRRSRRYIGRCTGRSRATALP